jgi:hypothetical protein
LASKSTQYLYCAPVYSIDKNLIPESFKNVFETNSLSNLEKEFEGEKFYMMTSVKIENVKIEFVNV